MREDMLINKAVSKKFYQKYNDSLDDHLIILSFQAIKNVHTTHEILDIFKLNIRSIDK